LPSALIVVAHPDDEVLGLGSRLPRMRNATLVHTTDGAPRDMHDAHDHGFSSRGAYANARRKELLAALGTAGLTNFRVWELGVVDQEAAKHMVELVRNIALRIWDTRPEIIITHPYEGGHPDHDATAFAVHTALRIMGIGRNSLPALIEMTSYHNGPNGMVTGEFIPVDACPAVIGEKIEKPVGDGPKVNEWPARTVTLASEERLLKYRMLDCYVTQQSTIKLFDTEVERFRIAPEYDFTRPPHEGKLFYEQFPWGMTGEKFRSLTAKALRELGATVGAAQ
jgi:LmbE family N-acetylglucosaminyl deacetylase